MTRKDPGPSLVRAKCTQIRCDTRSLRRQYPPKAYASESVRARRKLSGYNLLAPVPQYPLYPQLVRHDLMDARVNRCRRCAQRDRQSWKKVALGKAVRCFDG